MNTLWSYFWPIFGAGLVVGVVAGVFAYGVRHRRKWLPPVTIGILLAIGAAALWHGPLGAADRFSTSVETFARRTLVDWEVPQVQAHLHHDPLTRRLELSGPADEFQRSELVRIMGGVPGVSSARWAPAGAGTPLILEGVAASVVGFLIGLLLAYLVALRRRYNAQWRW